MAHRGASRGCELWKRSLASLGRGTRIVVECDFNHQKVAKGVILWNEERIIVGDLLGTLYSDFTTSISMMFPQGLPLIGLASAMSAYRGVHVATFTEHGA